VPPELRLGQYIVEGLLGPGGVTETYVARLAPDAQGDFAGTLAGRILALKLLRSDRITEKDFPKVAQRFLAAGKQLRDFHRPGFGKVVDLSDDPSATFVVTDFVAGTDLARLVEQTRTTRLGGAAVDATLAGLIGSEIARLLHVGHSAKPILCHLGLSPQNVIIKETGDVVLLDAGIASALRGMTEQPAERWSFVAPELQNVDVGSAGLGGRAGIAADLYALGALVHFLLTGESPPVAPRQERQTRPQRATMADLPGIPGNVNAALRTLLAVEPEDRPESAAVLVDWLASGVDAARDRRQLISEGIHAGPHVESKPNPARDSSPSKRLPPAAGSAEVVSTKGLPVRARGRRFRSTLGSIAFAVVLVAAGVGAMVAMGRWPGRKQTSPLRDGDRPGQASAESRTQEPSLGGGQVRPEQGETPATAEPAPGDSMLSRVAGHLIVETVPPGATVWVDGVIKGKTFADISAGEGGHRIVLIAPGHRMFRDVVDTTRGAIVRRTLVPVDAPTRGHGFINVDCWPMGQFPILLDEEETGLLCPAKMIPTSAGKHMVGIFVPPERRTILVETEVAIGAKPSVVKFAE